MGTGNTAVCTDVVTDAGTDSGPLPVGPTGMWATTTLTTDDTTQGLTSINVMLMLSPDMTFADTVQAQYGPSAIAARQGCHQVFQASGTWSYGATDITLSPIGGNVTSELTSCWDSTQNSPAAPQSWTPAPVFNFSAGVTTLTLGATHAGYDFLNRVYARQ